MIHADTETNLLIYFQIQEKSKWLLRF